jgi:hypothetical protein
VWYDDRLRCLRFNRYILIPDGEARFLINSHHFTVDFELDSDHTAVRFVIGGHDIDYLTLVEVIGIKDK